MKHQHFDVGTAGFYGAYWACAGGSDCAVVAMIGDDPEDRLARSAVKWLCGRGINVLTMSPAKKDYGHHNYPLERVETAISWLKANGNHKIGIAGASTTGTLALTATSFPGFQAAGFFSSRPQSRRSVLQGFSFSALSWLVAPFCLFAKEKSSRFLCENSCSWWVGYSVVRGLLSVRQTEIYLSKTILAATTGDPSSMICSLPSKRYPHRS